MQRPLVERKRPRFLEKGKGGVSQAPLPPLPAWISGSSFWHKPAGMIFHGIRYVGQISISHRSNLHGLTMHKFERA